MSIYSVTVVFGAKNADVAADEVYILNDILQKNDSRFVVEPSSLAYRESVENVLRRLTGIE